MENVIVTHVKPWGLPRAVNPEAEPDQPMYSLCWIGPINGLGQCYNKYQ